MVMVCCVRKKERERERERENESCLRKISSEKLNRLRGWGLIRGVQNLDFKLSRTQLKFLKNIFFVNLILSGLMLRIIYIVLKRNLNAV